MFFLFCSCIEVNAQPSIEWAKTFGGSESDEFFDIASTSDGGMICIGSSSSQDYDLDSTINSSFDVWVVKLDEQGQIIWSNTYGGSDNDYGFKILSLQNGDYILECRTFSFDYDVTNNHGGSDIWLIRIDSIGNIVWQNCYGGTNGELTGNIIQSIDNTFVVTGLSNSTDGDITFHYGDIFSLDVWVFMIDSSGSIIWQKTYGGTGNENSASLVDANGADYVLAIGTASFDGDMSGLILNGGYDFLIIKLDSIGTIITKKSLGGTGNEIPGSLIKCSNNSGYLLTGASSSTAPPFNANFGGSDGIAIKLDNELDPIWVKPYGGDDGDQLETVLQTENGSYVVVGKTQSTAGTGIITQSFGHEDFWCLRIDSSDGHLLWQESFGGSSADLSGGMCLLNDGKLILAGMTESNDGQVNGFKGVGDGWVLELNSYLGFDFLSSTSQNFLIYPNPATGIFHLELNDNRDKIKNVILYNAVGEEVKEIEIAENKIAISSEDLDSGIYLLCARTLYGNFLNQKIVIHN